MRAATQCSTCGAESTPDFASGLCVCCLLQLGLEAQDALLPGPGDRIGNYRLIQELGEGGCGVVFLAEQSEPVRRTVALKILKPGMDTREVVQRFAAERQVLALLDHPHIAKVFDAGETDAGRPFFVMELVRGQRITAYCDEKALSTRARLELFAEVCSAIQHAHQKGIIHRDLKPSNILVTAGENGMPPIPRIIDFGIAKSMEQSPRGAASQTSLRQLIGTPAYMSPEQAGRDEEAIDTRSDVYSLGVLLYELMTGLMPFAAKELRRLASEDVPRFIRETEPLKPSEKLARHLAATPGKRAAGSDCFPPNQSFAQVRALRADLDWVVMKCLEKNPARRYETAHALRQDVEHFLRDEPVEARPATPRYHLQKLVRRHRVAFASATLVLITLLAGICFSTWYYLGEREARRRAVMAESTEHQARLLAEASRQRALLEAGKTRELGVFLMELLRSASPSVSLGRDPAVLREIVDLAISRLGRDLEDQPEVEAPLRNTLAEVCGELGLYPHTEEMARQALRLGRLRADGENPVAAKALEQLAEALRLEDRLNDAETAAREALAIRKNLSPEPGAEVSASLNNLGLILRDRHQFAEAERLFREAIAIDTSRFGPEYSGLTAKLANLGAVLWSQENFTEAETAYQEALNLRRKLLGNEHPQVAVVLNNLATVLLSEGRLPEAESAAREALAMDRKFLGDGHPDLVIALNNLANILAAQGKLAEADALHRETQSLHKDPGLGGRQESGLRITSPANQVVQ